MGAPVRSTSGSWSMSNTVKCPMWKASDAELRLAFEGTVDAAKTSVFLGSICKPLGAPRTVPDPDVAPGTAETVPLRPRRLPGARPAAAARIASRRA